MEIDEVPIVRITEQRRSDFKDTVTVELPITIILDNRELVTLLCSPAKLDYLALGFLVSEGLIKSKDDIDSITIDSERGFARITSRNNMVIAPDLSSPQLIASSSGRTLQPYASANGDSPGEIKSGLQISPAEIYTIMDDFVQRSRIFRKTGGVHSAALSDRQNILLFSEDIGRHNAIDKVIGECLAIGLTTDDRIMITSGRVSSEIILKIARRNIPVLISKSAPTTLGVKIAADRGITLIGFVRGSRMNIYSHPSRVLTGKISQSD